MIGVRAFKCSKHQMTTTETKLIPAAEAARLINCPEQKFRKLMRARVIRADILSDFGRGRVALFAPERLPELAALVAAQRAPAESESRQCHRGCYV